jgi:hypothetical protein
VNTVSLRGMLKGSFSARSETHDVNNSKAQYTRQLQKWKISKNLTKGDWKVIAGHLKRRKLEGRESEIRVNGLQIPRKKLKKEISRYILPSQEQELSSGRR